MVKRAMVFVAAGMLAGCLALFGCSSGDGAGGGGSQDAADKQEPQAAGQQEQEAPESKYAVTIDDGVVGEDYKGNPALVVTFTFTNNSDDATSFLAAISDKAYQNGVQLESAIRTDGDSQSSMKDIKPGATVTVEQAYVLDDQSEVTVECTEFISFNDTVLAEKTFTVA